MNALGEVGTRLRYFGWSSIALDTPRGSLLFDPEWDLHYRYGAAAECVYLVRPDGYIGYRSQPADGTKLDAYLKTIFT